jgi:hypothetical protein
MPIPGVNFNGMVNGVSWWGAGQGGKLEMPKVTALGLPRASLAKSAYLASFRVTS